MVSLRYPPHSLSLSLFLSIYKEPRPRGYRLTVCGSSRPPPIKASSQSILHAMPRAEWPSHRPSALISESHILFSRRRVVGGGFRATTAVSAALAPPPPPCSTSSVFLVSNIFRPRQKFSCLFLQVGGQRALNSFRSSPPTVAPSFVFSISSFGSKVVSDCTNESTSSSGPSLAWQYAGHLHHSCLELLERDGYPFLSDSNNNNLSGKLMETEAVAAVASWLPFHLLTFTFWQGCIFGPSVRLKPPNRLSRWWAVGTDNSLTVESLRRCGLTGASRKWAKKYVG